MRAAMRAGAASCTGVTRHSKPALLAARGINVTLARLFDFRGRESDRSLLKGQLQLTHKKLFLHHRSLVHPPHPTPPIN